MLGTGVKSVGMDYLIIRKETVISVVQMGC